MIEIGERRISPTATHAFALALHVATEAPRKVSRSQLAELLFPAEPAGAALHNLRQLIYRLRRSGVPLRSSGEFVSLHEEDVVDLTKLASAKRYPHSRLSSSHGLSILPGYEPPTAPFSIWLEAYRDRQHRLLVQAFTPDLDAARRGGDWAAVEELASAILEIDPYHESATLCLAETMARTGSKQRALLLLRRYEEDTGRLHGSLCLAPQLLKKRIDTHISSSQTALPETPLVGRSSEMRELANSWSHARAGNFSIVLVSGEPSIGKSRLVSEFLSLVRIDGSGAVLSSRCLASDRQRPLSLFADLASQLLSLPGAAGCSPTSMPVLRGLTNSLSSSTTTEITHPYDHKRTCSILAELLDCVSTERALLLAIDDAHFLDTESLALLDDIVERSPHLRVLVILTGAVDQMRLARSRRLRIAPLERIALAEILDRRASLSQALEPDSREWLCTVAAGNPGHLELLLSSGVTHGQFRIPLTLLALTDERIASLSRRAQHALCTIAVIGSDCAVDTLSSVSGMKGYTTLRALEELEASFLIVVGPAGLRCRSLLIQERILAVASGSVKQLLHSRAARHVQRVFRSGAFSQSAAWRIAAHWVAAGSPERALNWQRRCWRHAIAIGKPTSAIVSITSALRDSHSPKERAALLDVLALAHRSQGDTASLLHVLRDRVALCDQCEDSATTRAALAFDHLEASLRQYDDDALHVALLRSFVVATDLDVMRRLRAVRSLIISAHNLLDPQLATEAHEINVSLPAKSNRAALLQKSSLLIYHTVFGDRTQALREADDLIALVRHSTLLSERFTVLLNVNLARRHVDAKPFDVSQVEELFSQGVANDVPAMALHLASQTASNLLDDGRLVEARNWARLAEAINASHRFDRLPMDYLCLQSHLAMIDGRSEDARKLIESMPLYSPKCHSGLTNNAVFVWNILFKKLCLQQSATPDELERLRSYHYLAQSYGKHDYHIEALWMALTDSGLHSEAHAVLRDYLTHTRRERRAPNFTLRLRTADDPFWASAPASSGFSDTSAMVKLSPGAQAFTRKLHL